MHFVTRSHHTHLLHGRRNVRGHNYVVQYLDVDNFQGGYQLSRNRYILGRWDV